MAHKTDADDDREDGDSAGLGQDRGGKEGKTGGSTDRRSFLQLTGGTLATGLGLAGASRSASAAPEVTQGDGYEIWTVTSKETYQLSENEELSNVLIDQTAEGACLTIFADTSGWEVRNVGFLGVGQAGSGGNRFQFQVSCPEGGSGLIENVWMNGKARNGQSASEMGGIWLRSSHAGHIDIRHTYIEGFGNNAVYGSGVGKNGHNEGSVVIENAYHRDNTVSQFRIGSPGSVVRNSVGIVDDPEGRRGSYPGSGSQYGRGIWGKHFPNQRVENTSFYISPDDVDSNVGIHARYIDDTSRGDYAEIVVDNCHINSEVPTRTASTSNAEVNVLSLDESPTVEVIGGDGVPLSPKMAARGERQMPPELPGVDGSSDDSSTDPDSKTLTIDGSDASRTDYEFTVDGELQGTSSLGSGDSVDGTTGSGFVNGGVDEYQFTGQIAAFTRDGDAPVLVDGNEIDLSQYGSDRNVIEVVTTEDPSVLDYTFTTTGKIEPNYDAETNPATSNDSVSQNDDGTWSADGYTGNGYGDTYYFQGELTDFGPVKDFAEVRVNGTAVDLSQYDPGSAPTIERYEVVEAGSRNDDANLIVTWAVTDEDEDLSEVRLEILDENGSVVDSIGHSVQGQSAYDADYFELADVPGQTFDVQLTVVDAAEKETSATKTVQE